MLKNGPFLIWKGGPFFYPERAETVCCHSRQLEVSWKNQILSARLSQFEIDTLRPIGQNEDLGQRLDIIHVTDTSTSSPILHIIPHYLVRYSKDYIIYPDIRKIIHHPPLFIQMFERLHVHIIFQYLSTCSKGYRWVFMWYLIKLGTSRSDKNVPGHSIDLTRNERFQFESI